MRRISRLGVTAIGLVLVLWGLASMWTGWDQIMVERGWSLFIAGAALVAGGAVTFSAGFILARLDALTRVIGAEAGAASWLQRQRSAAEAPPHAKALDAQTMTLEPQGEARRREALAYLSERPLASLQSPTERAEPAVIDRYDSGDATFTMYSDGSVIVRSAAGAQRYESVSELRAQMEL